jgi:MarR family transcriptional regulator, transcriptional regulator for hemolysin
MSRSPEDDFLFLLYDVARLMRVRADQRARLTGMTRAQWVLLVWLERRPGITQNDLAALVEVEPITVARLVDRLEARGVVERRLDPRDRRVRRLHLTAAAEPLLKTIQDYRRELEEVSTAGISEADKRRIAAGLVRMKQNILEDRRIAVEIG